jgi:magnesium-transporting ATPase (P-type)
MVLADDDFTSIISAVEEGRSVYVNLQKAILFILPTNGGEALVILATAVLDLVNSSTDTGTNFMGKYDHRCNFGHSFGYGTL